MPFRGGWLKVALTVLFGQAGLCLRRGRPPTGSFGPYDLHLQFFAACIVAVGSSYTTREDFGRTSIPTGKPHVWVNFHLDPDDPEEVLVITCKALELNVWVKFCG